jgi:acyl-ACP thioesterase
MKFGIQFDFHKIPEWYSEYFDYLRFKLISKDFSERVKSKSFTILINLFTR